MPVKRRRKRLDVVLAVLLGLASPSLLAQETSELSLYVFDGGLPVAGVEIFVDDELRLVSNVNGLAEVQLEPGIHYIQLRLQDSVVHEQQILAVQDEYAQWIIDVTGGGSAFFDVESTSPMAAGVAATAATLVAFLDADGVVVKTMQMHQRRIGVPVWRATLVVEAEAGAFARWGLRVGDVGGRARWCVRFGGAPPGSRRRPGGSV